MSRPGRPACPSRREVRKLVDGDFAVQASITNVLENNRLVAVAARASDLASPLLEVCHALYGEALAQGHGDADVVAVVRAIEARTAAQTQARARLATASTPTLDVGTNPTTPKPPLDALRGP